MKIFEEHDLAIHKGKDQAKNSLIQAFQEEDDKSLKKTKKRVVKKVVSWKLNIDKGEDEEPIQITEES